MTPLPSPRAVTLAIASPPHIRGRASPRRRLVVLSIVSFREVAEPRLSLTLAFHRHRRVTSLASHRSENPTAQFPAIAAVGRASSLSRRQTRSPHVSSHRVAPSPSPSIVCLVRRFTSRRHRCMTQCRRIAVPSSQESRPSC
uniref:Uncharacterized protein n=1 Tax=Oryza sativa subsp. japonica TaxID=39947 RepID=Q6YSG1_ORYSJ|nr:hypothetical protein [Oryza sativa Japonica Group]BAD31921.1 hypothetical protein [Oryza sativa Japonica Group]